MMTAAAIAAAVFTVAPAGAGPSSCIDGGNFVYCGEHIPLSRLPFTFKLRTSGAPVGAGGAVKAAIDEWNRAWPKVLPTPNGFKIELGPCAPLCYGGTTTASAPSFDGINTIGWGAPEDCTGEGVAVARLWYDDSANTRIREVDIVLCSDKVWRVADNSEQAVGEAQGSFSVRGTLIVPDADWYDVQSVVTHELGHALGLEDIGHDSRPWPGTFMDAPKHNQTMYRWYALGSTNKRTLAEGDILALTLAALESASDA